MNEQAEMITRTIIGVITVANLILQAFGWQPFDIEYETLYTAVSAVAAVVAIAWNWYKNNNVTPDAKLSQKVLNGLKDGELLPNEVNELLDKEKE